jgi:hypothetical protein
VASAAAWYRTVEFGLCPVCGFEVEHDDVGEMLAMLVLTAKDEKFTALPKTCGVS